MGYGDSRGPNRGGRRGSHDARHRSHEVYRTAPYGSDRGGRKRGSRAQPDTEVIEVSSNRLYVHNLAWRVSWQDLKDHFRQAGEVVRSEIFTQGPGGRSKGCGIVEMASVDDAANAVEKLVDSELHGRRILIREDRESGRRGEDRRDNYDQSQHSRSFRENANTEVIEVSSNRLYVHNLAWRVSWQDLKDHFRQAGEVVRSEIFTQGPGGRSKGCGIVEMASVDDAANAVEKLVDSELHGRRILIREDRESGRRGEDRQAGREDSLHREDAFEENEGGRTPPVDAPPEPQASDFEDVTPSEKQMTSST